MTDRTATGWAQAGALYEAIFGGRRSLDLLRVPCAVGASDPAPSKRSTQMMSFMPTLMQTLRMARLLTILLVPALAACGQSQSQPQASSPPPQVTIAKPVSKMVADQDEYVGRFVAVESVEVRARVPGYLEAIHFQDGQMVKEAIFCSRSIAGPSRSPSLRRRRASHRRGPLSHSRKAIWHAPRVLPSARSLPSRLSTSAHRPSASQKLQSPRSRLPSGRRRSTSNSPSYARRWRGASGTGACP
jgi:hypothetical protein